MRQFRSVGAHGPDLDEQAAITLFRVAQSILANVREHARASSLFVTLRQGADPVELEVYDDGVGFDLARVGGERPSGRGFGLPAARARFRAYGGDLAVDSAPTRGTRIRATVPARPRPGARPTASPTVSATASPTAAVR